jgi:hypothetical protein
MPDDFTCQVESAATHWVKQKVLYTSLNGTSDIRAVGSSFLLAGGLKARAGGPRKFFNLGHLESLKCHFLDFGEDLTEF